MIQSILAKNNNKEQTNKALKYEIHKLRQNKTWFRNLIQANDDYDDIGPFSTSISNQLMKRSTVPLCPVLKPFKSNSNKAERIHNKMKLVGNEMELATVANKRTASRLYY